MDRPPTVAYRRAMHVRLVALLTIVACGAFFLACGGGGTGSSASSGGGSASGGGGETSGERENDAGAPEADDPVLEALGRALPAGATFADLAAAARHQDDMRDQDSTSGCILTARSGAFELTSDLAVAVRPLPVPEADLDARMAGAAPVRVLTRYGSYGEGAAVLGLTAMTTTAPPDRAVALVVFLTDRGAYARRTDVEYGDVTPRPMDELVGVLPYGEVATTFVTAEAGVSVETLVAFLRALPSTLTGNVGLAVALEAGTRMPEAAALPDEEDAPICAALPEAPADAREGTLEPADIVAALGPLRTAAAICVGATPGPGARGGRIGLAARIGEGGRVVEACITADATGDAHLRTCVLRAARALVFPDPGGLVDFALPLSLAPGPAHHQRPVCE